MGRQRQHARTLSARARAGDAIAARDLLAHNIRLGHGRLSLRRFFVAQALGAPGLAAFQRYCEDVAATLSTDQLAAVAVEAQEIADRARTLERHGGR